MRTNFPIGVGFDWGRLVLLGLLAAALGGGSSASADMVLSDIIVDLQAPGEMRYDIEVWNSGEEPLFVDIKATEVLDPAGDESVRRILDDPRSAGLLASPNRLVVAPNERKRVRLAARTMPTDRDLVYRVAFVPKENTTRTTKQLAFKVLIGYEVLVLIRPPDARPLLEVSRVDQQLHFENSGQSSVLLRKLEFCPTASLEPTGASGREAAGAATDAQDAGEASCQELPGNRLYAGETWDVSLPGEGQVRVFESYRSENRISVH